MENLLTAEQFFSLQDYESTDVWELIKGVLRMSPSPRPRHQKILGDLYLTIGTKYRKSNKFYVRIAPYDVNINETSVVRPDVCVIDDITKETERCYQGVPILIIEVLSPSSIKHDKQRKFELYEECGVPEYWIVSPDDCSIQVFTLVNKKYTCMGIYGEGEIITSKILPDLVVNVDDVFY